MDILSELLDALHLHARIQLHATFCDRWQVDLGEDQTASFHVVSEGECWLHLPNESPVALHAGDLVFLPRNSRHAVAHSAAQPTTDTPRNRPAERVTGPSTTLLCGRVEFELDDWNPLIQALPDYVILPARQYASATLGRMVESLITEAESGERGSRVVMDRLADVLFVEIVRLYVSKQNNSSYLAAIGDPRLGVALAQFHASVDKRWSIETLAEAAGMSRSSFAARFNELVGISPMRYVTRWRMQLGKRLLATTEWPIVQIAERCGYASEESFAKAIKKEFGQGPRAVRRHHRIAKPAPMVTVGAEGPRSTKVLFSPQEAQRLRNSNAACFVDVRSPEEYARGHIPGAVNVPESYNLLSETTPEGLGEMANTLGEVFAEAGVDPERQLIAYEDSLTTRFGASCRCYFQLALLGHSNVGILDGGLDRWTREGYPLSQEPPLRRGSDFQVNLQSSMLATIEDMIDALDDPATKILDNRDLAEWRGAASAPEEDYGADFAPRKGRIPGACWIEWTRFMRTRDGVACFRTPDEIVAICAQAGLYPDDEIIIYCFKGSRSSNTYVALRNAGFKRVKNYYGSWNEWSRNPELPVMSTMFRDDSTEPEQR